MENDVNTVKQYTTEEEPQHAPVEGKVKGTIPTWLSGSLYRNGPGKYQVGDTKYNHFFDGLALLHRWSFKDGRVFYQSRLVESDTYKKNMAANRIVVSEFGTLAFPDPCKNMFQRFFSYFKPLDDPTDNTSVNIFPVSDDLYAATESTFIRKIDWETLASPSKVDLKKLFAVHTATAHPHVDSDGTIHNIGLGSTSAGPNYSIIKIPPKDKEVEDSFSKAEVVTRIPARWKWSPCYSHSFAMTENYYVILEQPLAIRMWLLFVSKIFRWPGADSIKWYDGYNTIFHVIDKKTGEKVNDLSYETRKLFTFHHANAYEDEDHIIVDLSGYNDGAGVSEFKVDKPIALKKEQLPEPRRYVIPLSIDKENDGTNLVTLPDSKATAIKKDKTVTLTYERLAEDAPIEFPMINYKYNTKKYRYLYGGSFSESFLKELAKIDTKTGQTYKWREDFAYPSEPVFVASPDANDEDDGVILSSVLKYTDPETSRGFLLVLDAKDMKEIGRSEFPFHIAKDFHGNYFPNR